MVSRWMRALREAHEEHLIVDRLGGVGLGARRARIVQEHQVQVRRVTELVAAQFSVPHRAEPDHVPRAVAVAVVRHAELRGHLPPGQLHRLLDDDFGDLGEVVADAHQRNLAR